jgi:hypothetical protein
MVLSCTRQQIRTSLRRVDRLLVVPCLSLAISLIVLLFGAAPSEAADSCLDNLPAPTPLLHRVVQLVNCSNQRVLGTANAAHVVGSPPTPVFPREKTWVMEPFPVPSGSPANANVLTIDIPKAWEDTSPQGSTGPNFWVRTGCRYDVATGLAQCETGGAALASTIAARRCSGRPRARLWLSGLFINQQRSAGTHTTWITPI